MSVAFLIFSGFLAPKLTLRDYVVYLWNSWTFSKEDTLDSIIHNYKHGFSGFAALLTEEQAKQLAGQVFPFRL